MGGLGRKVKCQGEKGVCMCLPTRAGPWGPSMGTEGKSLPRDTEMETDKLDKKIK